MLIELENTRAYRPIFDYLTDALEERLKQQVQWVAAEHDDHAPHRHVHIVAVVAGRLNVQDFQALRLEATQACLNQRHERDLAREQKEREQEREEAQWERGY